MSTILLLFAGGANAAVIFPENTGLGIWTVTGGVCPIGTDKCTAGTPFNNSPTYVPTDASSVWPEGGVGVWATAPFWAGEISQWIVPATRADGTVDFPPPGPIEPLDVPAPMDFGIYTYEFSTSFFITDASDLIGFMLTGVYLADGKLDAACGLLINGVCNSVLSIKPDSYSRAAGNSFAAHNGFAVGANVITFRVVNELRETGLRVSFGTPEPSAFVLAGLGLSAVALLRRRSI